MSEKTDKEAAKAEAKANKERAKEEAKIQKYRSAFLDPTSNLASRQKAFLNYCELESDEGVGPTFREHHIHVLSTMSDVMNSIDINAKKGKHIKEDECKNLMGVVRKIIMHLNDDLKDSRNARFICTIIERFLYIENQHNVRLMGIDLLMQFLETVPEFEDAWKLMISSLNFQAFQGESGRSVLLPMTHVAPDKALVFIPHTGNTVSGKREVMEMMDKLFLIAEKSKESFSFWYDMILAIVALLYPEAAVAAGVPGSAAERGFVRGSTPPDLQAIITQHLCLKWVKVDFLKAHFLRDLMGYNLLMDFYQSAMKLPQSYATTTAIMMGTIFPFIIMNKTHPLLKPEELLAYQARILDDTTLPFDPAPGNDGQEHISTCMLVIKMFNTCLTHYTELDPATRKEYLYTLLKAAKKLLTPQPQPTNPETVQALRIPIMNHLLTAWLSTCVTDPAMWSDFHSTLEPLMISPEVIKQIKLKLIHLTLVIRDTCYPVNPNKNQKSDAPVIAGKVKKEKVVWSLDSHESIEQSVNYDSALSSLQWNRDVLLWVWHALLHSFHNVNSFVSPKMYEGAMNVITDVLDLLLCAEENTAVEVSVQQSDNANKSTIPLVNVFGQYLFTACKLEDTARNSGVNLAYGALCRLFCRRYPQYPSKLLSSFYQAIRAGLMNPDKTIAWTIMNNTYNIFTINLPGASVLLPYYLNKGTEMLLLGTPPPRLAQNGKKKIISMLSSVVCYPHHYPNLSVPSTLGDGRPFTASDLRELVYNTLVAALFVQMLDSEAKTMAIWSIYLAVCEEFEHFDGECIKKLITGVLTTATKEDAAMARAALAVVQQLSCYAPRMPADLLNEIILTLCKMTSQAAEAIVPQTYLVLIDWIISETPVSNFQAATLAELFKVLERGLLSGHVQPNSLDASSAVSGGDSAQGSNSPIVAQKKTDPRVAAVQKPQKKTNSRRVLIGRGSDIIHRGEDDAEGDSAVGAQHESSNAESGNPDVIGHKLTVRETAEIFMNHLLHFKHNYPMPVGVDCACSRLIESDDGFVDQDWTHWQLNEEVTFSVADIPPGKIDPSDRQEHARIILRDTVGCWVWDFTPLRIPSDTGLPEAVLVDESMLNNTEDGSEEPQMSRNRTRGTAVFSDLLPATNKVTKMLDDVISGDPDLSNWTGSLKDPTLILATSASVVDDGEKLMNELTSNEQSVKTIHGPHQKGNLAVAPAAIESVSSSQLPVTSRLLLNQLGLVAPDSSLSPNFRVLSLNEKLKRNITVVDRAPTRMVHKIGLIYVREGQELQNDILANSNGSELYKDFVAGLGWPVDLATHRGYIGGLDKNGCCGRETLYWADSRTEVVFHQVVTMPTKPDDPQQIQKKRHVGNDFVHVIWCEHIRDYNPLTITSRFNEAHIAIYPEPSGLFRIQVFRNIVNPLFGPAQHGMLVCKRLLPKIVRETAINADVSVSSQFNPESFSQPYLHRLRSLGETHARYRAPPSSQGFYRYNAMIFGQEAVLQPPPASASTASTASTASQSQASPATASSTSTTASSISVPPPTSAPATAPIPMTIPVPAQNPATVPTISPAQTFVPTSRSGVTSMPPNASSTTLASLVSISPVNAKQESTSTDSIPPPPVSDFAPPEVPPPGFLPPTLPLTNPGLSPEGAATVSADDLDDYNIMPASSAPVLPPDSSTLPHSSLPDTTATVLPPVTLPPSFSAPAPAPAQASISLSLEDEIQQQQIQLEQQQQQIQQLQLQFQFPQQ